MKVYTYSEARQSLARILDGARDGIEVRIKRPDGSEQGLELTLARFRRLRLWAMSSGPSFMAWAFWPSHLCGDAA